MKIRPCEPPFDRQAHRSLEELQAHLQADRKEPTKKLQQIVHRQQDGSRNSPEETYLSIERGVVGDRWYHDPERKRVEQIAIMDWHVASVIANGQSLTLFGDNLFLDYRVGELAVGQYFSLGDAILVVTEEPHNGCSKFAMRFGAAALKLTCLDKKKKLRGIYAAVEREGKVSIGDRLELRDFDSF